MTDVVELELARHGEDDVRHGRRWGHEQVRHGHEVQLFEGLIGHGAVGVGHEGVGAHGVEPPDRVGDILQDGLPEKSGGDGHEPGDDPVVGAQHLLPLLGDEIGPDELPEAHDPGIHGLHVSPRHGQVPGNRHEANEGPGDVEGVDVVLYGIAPLDDRRP